MRFTIAFSIIVFALAAKADSIAYEIASSRDFGTVDLNTGVYTEIGQTPNVQMAGLGEVGGTLYEASTNASGTLYAVNTTTAGLTMIGGGTSNSFNGYFAFGSTTTGLYGVGSAAVNGKLYVALWSINPATGIATLVGPTGTNGFGGTTSLSTGSGSLYYTLGASLYTLNTTTGSATLIGTSAPAFQSLATVFENNTLYGALDSPCCSFYSLNTSTGGASSISSQTGGPLGGLVYGLAPFPATGTPTPEPAPLGILGSALVVLSLIVRKRRARSFSPSAAMAAN